MLRIYRTWIQGKEKLVKANSKKEVVETFGTDKVDFWCNITKRNEQLFKNLPICNQTSNRMAGFIDNTGATRHAISREELSKLYDKLGDFIADLTFEEVEKFKKEFMVVKTLIATRMREKTIIL